MTYRLALILTLCLAGAPAFGQLSPPTIQSARPIAASPGEPFAAEIKGTDLDSATSLAFEAPGVRIDGFSPSSTSIKARITFPAETQPGLHSFRVVGPKGHSNPVQIHVGRPVRTIAEIEPNDGFRKPQTIAEKTVAVDARIEPGNDVDVYAIPGNAGETLTAEVIAARAGSGLDALITVFGPDLREVAADDDTLGQDASIVYRIKTSGRYFVQVQDADGKHRDGKIEQTKVRPYRLEIGTLAPISPSPTLTIHPDHEIAEREPNDSDESPQTLTVPATVIGQFATSRRNESDVDVYRLKGNSGMYRISALATRIGSPADPVLTVLDEKGDTQAENDDSGTRDARVDRRIDAKGPGLLVAVRDYYGRSGPRFAYRLDIERIPDRSITVTTDLGARVVPRGGSIALPIRLDRRNADGPLTILTGATPPGISAVPVTLAPGSNSGFLLVSATASAPLGVFPFRLTTRDTHSPTDLVYRDRSPLTLDSPSPGWLVVTEPTTLGLHIEPAEITLGPGASSTVKVLLDRLNETAKKAPVKVKLVALDGNLDGLEPLSETTVAPGSDSATFTLKSRPDARSSRHDLTAIARFDSSPEAFAVASSAASLVVSGR